MNTAPLRTAVVGAGFFGGALAMAAQDHPRFQPVHVVDPDASASAALAAQVGAEPVATLEEALAARPDIVLVATPNHLHARQACQVLAAGIDVYVEKPLTTTAQDAAALVAAASESGRHLLVGHILRTLPGIKRMHEVATSGEIGDLIEGCGRRSRVMKVPAGAQGWWKMDRARSGGEMLHELHELDLLVWHLGKPVEVQSWSGGPAELGGQRVDSVQRTLLRFPSGAIAVHELSSMAHHGEWSVRISGTTGAIEADFRTSMVRVMRHGQVERQWEVFDEAASNDSLRAAATGAQGHHVAGARGPQWMLDALRCELDEVDGALRGKPSVLSAHPTTAVLAALTATAQADAAGTGERTGLQ